MSKIDKEDEGKKMCVCFRGRMKESVRIILCPYVGVVVDVKEGERNKEASEMGQESVVMLECTHE